MRKLLSVLLLTQVFVSFAHSSEMDKHLFILSGQSNMVGLNLNISFIPAVEEAFGKDNITVVKYAKNGQPIRRWYKNWKPSKGDKPIATGDLYDRLMKNVYDAIKGKKFETVTFIWMQGERDASDKHGEVYEDSLKGLIKQLSDDLGRKNINFVIGRLSDFDIGEIKRPHWIMVRKAQVKVAEANPYGAWVNTDDLNDGIIRSGKQILNDLHYSVDGYKKLGKYFADESIKLIENSNQRAAVTGIKVMPLN
jgi:hypothetical protein